MKRILSVLLCLMMFISLATPAAYAMDIPVSSDMGLSMDDIYFGDGANVVYNEDGSMTITSSDKSTLMPSELMGGNENTSTSDQGTMTEVPEELGQASATVEDVTVDALGVPKDSSLVIQNAKPEMDAAIEQVAAEQEGSSSELFRYDISVQDKEGLDWQPNGKVRLELDAGQKLHKNQKVYVVHVSDDGVAEKIDAKVNAAGKIEFETEGFSTFAGFTVDFEYEDAKFCINGLESILLSEVFKNLGMPLDVEDVKDVTFTDYSLIAVEKQGSDWLLTSLKAFDTTEALTMTMTDGTVYEIKVTDDIYSENGKAKAYLQPTLNSGGTGLPLDTSENGVIEIKLNDVSGGAVLNENSNYTNNNNYGIVVTGSGVLEIVLQNNTYGTTSVKTNLKWLLPQLYITGGAKVIVRLGASFTGGETITIETKDDAPIFNIEDGSLYLRIRTDYADILPSGATTGEIDKRPAVKMIVDGNNKATDANSALIFAQKDADNVAIENVTFREAKYRACYINCDNLGLLYFRDCTFESSVRNVEYGGGAIYINGFTSSASDAPLVNVSKFKLIGCTFDGQVSGSMSGNGGAIASYSDQNEVLIDSCTFKGCKTSNQPYTDNEGNQAYRTGRGGAISFTHSKAAEGRSEKFINSLTIKNSKFIDCESSSHGGAIDISYGDTPILVGDISISGTLFSNCTSANRGGAIRLVLKGQNDLTITDSGFSGCNTGSHGGISLQNEIGNIYISGSYDETDEDGEVVESFTFRDGSAGARGGAVAVMCKTVGNVTLKDAIFLRNTADTLGGAVHVGIDSGLKTNVAVGAVSVTGCTFNGNVGNGVGGGLSLTDGTYKSVTVKTSTFTNCHSENYGGAIGMKVYSEDAKNIFQFKVTGAVLIEDCSFSNCTSGALSPEPYDHDGDPNTAQKETWDHDGDPSTDEILRLNGGGGGGAICIGGEVGTSITIRDTSKDAAAEFYNCYAWNNGGAISFLGEVKTPLITIGNLDIDGCRARDAGNTFYLSSLIANDLKMDNCKITNCSYFSSDFVVPEVLQNSYYNELGAAAYYSFDAGGNFRSIGNTTCRAEITNCHFEGNVSYENGAGVYWNANNVRAGATVKDEDGNDVDPTIIPSLKLSGCTFKDNIAERDGGGVFVEATVIVKDCDFESNEAWGRGGAIAQQVYNNEARKLGDTGTDEATDLLLDKDTVIWNNHATHGGGISITVSDTVSLQKTDGKYINYPVRFQLGGATVRDNWATGNGGGIYYATTAYADAEIQKKIDSFQKEILIDNGLIYGNKTGCDQTGAELAARVADTQNGGGIYMFSNQPNTGTDTTTGQVFGYSRMTITGGNIYSNIANGGDGGGIYLTGKGASCLITGGTIGADANGAEMPNKALRDSPNGGNGGGIAIHGGAKITMRRPWLEDANGNWLDQEGNITTDESQCVEDTSEDGGFVKYNIAERQGAGIWLAGGDKDAGTANSIIISGGTISDNEVDYGWSQDRNGGVYVGTDGSLSFTGGTISNCTTVGWGGGVFLDTGASATIDGGIISGCTAVAGGGIAFQGEGYLEFKGGSINGNTATNDGNAGGGIYDNGTDGKAEAHTTIIINGGNIYGNHATGTGGHGGGIAGVCYTNITISSGSVYDNDATGNGGGVYLYDNSYLKLSGGNIGSATEGQGNEAQNGGGIYADNSEVLLEATADASTGNVIGNSATANGGGVYATNSATVTVNGDVQSNTAIKGGGIYGDGKAQITVNGNLYLNKVGVNNDDSEGGGAAIYGEGTKLTVSGNIGAKDKGNWAYGRGGGVYITDAELELKTTGGVVGQIAYNTAKTGQGGGINAHDATITIGGNVSYNEAPGTQYGMGGGIYASGSTVTVNGTVSYNSSGYQGGGIFAKGASDIDLFGNVNNNVSATGGGLYASDGSDVLVEGGTINNNTASGWGGGAYVTGSGSKLVLKKNASGQGGEISGNQAQNGRGGGIDAENSANIEIYGVVNGNTASTSGSTDHGCGGGIAASSSATVKVYGKITNNIATTGGGGAHIEDATLELLKDANDVPGEISGNTATNYDGGGIYGHNSTLTIQGNILKNTANNNGGGIKADTGCIVSISGNVTGNTATNQCGGGVFQSGGTLTVNGVIGGSAANANKALGDSSVGGGLYVTGSCQATIDGSITYNEATNGGGAAAYSSATLNINGHLDNNKATTNGGGAYVSGATLNINKVDTTDGTVDGNTAGTGGGIYATSSSTVKIDGHLYSNVASSGNGGGAYLNSGADMTITGTVGSEGKPNKAAKYGGGIHATGDGTTVIVKNSIQYNESNRGGGASVWSGASLTVDGGNIQYNIARKNNTSTGGGGGIYASSGTVTITSGNIQYNHAESFAGGMYCGGASKVEIRGFITGNTADGNGGGVYCEATSSGAPVLDLYGSVTNNKAKTNGGGMYVSRGTSATESVGAAEISIIGGSVTNNHANCAYDTEGVLQPVSSANYGDGGGVYIKAGSLTLKASDNGTVGNIYQNSAVNGGGIYAIDSTLNIAGDIQENDAVFSDPNNTYTGVARGQGGGIYAKSSDGTTEITLSGNIQDNTAQLFGGGAYIEGSGATMEITGGNVTGNTATRRNGGGLLVSTGASVTIANGEISGNKALGSGLVFDGKEEKGYGGGVHAYNGGEITITGGSITNNQADFGGGIAAEINAVVNFTNTVSMTDDGGNLSQNRATEYGGGIYAEASSVTVSGGTISGNTAKYGGGIAAVYALTVGASDGTAADPTCSVSVNGGAITSNYAEFGGGVYAKDGGTLVTVNGGSITMNQARSDYAKVDLETKANGSGGGIYVDGANVSVNKVGEAAGRIEANEASRGGGVYVTNGGDLTVKGGYIVKNVANGDLDKVGTALHMNIDLEGTGGGIFIADGASASDKSTFTLVSQENGVTIPVAIYGNLADYAADDVFANGRNTDLNVPLVTEMDLAGYDFKPGGWFEDYPIDDPYYTSGLNMSAETKQDVGDNNVYRYRGAAVLYRVEITPTGNSLKANNENTYVCMTLGIPGALPEDIVMDFGLPVDIDALNNDLVIRNEHTSTTQVLVGLQHPTTTDEAGNVLPLEYVENLPAGYTFGTSIDGKYGKITVVETSVVKNGQTVKSFTIRYELDDMEFIGVESFTYAVCYDEMWYFADVRIVPATIIYFEDDFVSFEDGKWTPVKDKDSVGSQDGDRPGEDVNDALGSLDMDSVYGYDSHYANKDNVYATYSNGSVHKTTVSGDSHAKATFTFWGTGFDVISLTSNTSGTVLVNVDRLDVAEDRQSFMVDTYYSYIYDTTTQSWVVAAAGKDNAIYQIPVIRVDDLAYGHYSVEVYVAYHEWFGHDRESYDFYLDAIRIYKPANDGVVTDSNGNVTDTTIRDIYLEDGECWPVFEELRDILLPGAEVESLHAQILEKREKLADPALTEEEKAALVAEIEALDAQLDALLDDKMQEGSVVFIDGSGAVASVKEYGFSGPNNELYLAKDQAIYTTVSSDTNIASVHLGIKSLNGTGTIQIWSGSELKKTLTIYGAMDMYYDVTGMGVLTIKNVSDDPSVLISITNVKTTYKADPYGTSGTLEGSLDADGNGLRTALAVLSGTTETVTQPTLTLKYPSLSFEEEIRYNVYYTASDLEDVVEMGLITFGSKLADGTIENALDVIPGYVTNGEMFMVSSSGITARDMGDDLYFKVYAKLSDGSYVYTDLKSYSAVAYATTILGRETSSDASKALVVALLKYGAAAQSYFGDEGMLMDASLTAEQLALIGAYEDLTIADPITPDASKTAAFVKNGFIKGMPSVSFDGIFTINYYFYPEHEVQGDMKLYYWDVDTYESVEELTVENASGYITMAATDDGAYCGSYSDIAAKEIEQTLFVAAVYECDGVTYTTNVIGYSLAAYCKTIAAKETSDMKDLAKATAVYGYYAGAYFTEA